MSGRRLSCLAPVWACRRSFASAAPSAPPLLLKLRKDMKTAMQNKDSNRLSVLRSLLAQTLNASKSSAPINTDIQMLALLRKHANASKVASSEFRQAGRQDLAEKEDSQVVIMEEYAGTVETVDEAEIRDALDNVIEAIKKDGGELHLGDILKKVFSAEALGGKPVERRDVARIAKQILEGS